MPGVDAQMNLQRLWQPSLDQDILSLSTERRSGHSFSPLTEKVSAVDICWQTEKLVFSSGVSLCISTVHPGRPHGQRYLAYPRGTQWHFCGLLFCFALFGHFLIFQSSACLFVFMWGWLCSLFCFVLFFFKEESKLGWVGRWGRSGRNWERGKTWSKYIIWKDFFLINLCFQDQSSLMFYTFIQSFTHSFHPRGVIFWVLC